MICFWVLTFYKQLSPPGPDWCLPVPRLQAWGGTEWSQVLSQASPPICLGPEENRPPEGRNGVRIHCGPGGHLIWREGSHHYGSMRGTWNT